MKINLHSFEKHIERESELRKSLGIAETVQIEIALDLVHGLNELARSVAQLHPHKRSIAVLGAQPPPLKEIIKGFAGEGFAIQELPVSFMAPNDVMLAEAWEKLKKDTLFVLGSAVEPLTGARYPFDWIRAAAPAKSIFSLVYYSPDALKRELPVPLTPWEGMVLDPLWNADHSLVLVLKGERCQGEKLLWGTAHFSDVALKLLGNKLLESKNSKGSNAEDPTVVNKFESAIKEKLGETIHILPPACLRVFDRAVFFIDGVNGDALSHALSQKGLVTFTGAACSWNNPHLNPWLPHTGISVEMVQSSLLVPLETIKRDSFLTQLLDEVARLRKISNFK